jgi:branched-chain amino acid transport system substrate-binding protein
VAPDGNPHQARQKPGEETMIVRLRFVAASAAMALLCAPSVSAAGKDPLEIGMAVALTGYLANYDGQFIDGAKLAAKHANDAGGIAGHEVKLHVLDNASNATTGVTVTNQLLNQFNVTVMLNGLSSAQNAAVHPILAKAKVPMLVFSILPPNPTWAFLANVPQDRVQALSFQFANEKLHAKKIAVVYSQTPYGQVGAKLLAGLAQKAGVSVLASEGVEPSATDMTPQMAKVKDAGVDAVIDILTGSTHIVEAKAAATVGLKVPIVMASDDMPTYQKSAAAYPNVNFALAPAQAYPNVPDPALKSAIEAFSADYKKSGLDMARISGASFGWDAMKILSQAVEKSGATSGDGLREALEKVTVQGTNTVYKFTPTDHSGQNDVKNELQIGKFQGDKVEIVFASR